MSVSKVREVMKQGFKHTEERNGVIALIVFTLLIILYVVLF